MWLLFQLILSYSITVQLSDCLGDAKNTWHPFPGANEPMEIRGRTFRTRLPRPPIQTRGQWTIQNQPPSAFASQMFDDSSNFQRFQRFHRGWRPFGPPVPPFLLNATAAGRSKFRVIMCSRNLTRSERERRIDLVVANETIDVQKAYLEYKKRRDEDIAEFEEKRKSAVMKLSPEAQAADAKVALIIRDDSLTHGERLEKIRTIMDGLDESVREELRTVAPKRFMGRPGGRHGGNMGSITGVIAPVGLPGMGKRRQFGVFGSFGQPEPMGKFGSFGQPEPMGNMGMHRWKKPFSNNNNNNNINNNNNGIDQFFETNNIF